MRLIQFEDQPGFAKNVAVGLEWMTTNTKEFKNIRKALGSQNKEWLTLASSNPSTKEMLNYGVVDRGALPQGSCVSLAAWLALSFRQGAILAVEEVEDKQEGLSKYWMCLINDGQVLAGTDILEDDWDTVEEFALGSVEALGDEQLGYVGNAANRLSFVSAEAEHPNLADVLDRAAFRKARFRGGENSGARNRVAFFGLIVLVVGSVGWYGMNAYLDAKNIESQQQRNRENQIERAREEYQNILNDLGGMAQAGPTIRTMWKSVLFPTETRIGGWELEAIECAEKDCQIQYKNTDLTLPEKLQTRLDGFCDSLTIDAEGIVGICAKGYEDTPIAHLGELPIVTDEQIIDVLLTKADLDRLLAGFMTLARMAQGSAYAINSAVEYPFRGSRWLPDARVFRQGEWSLVVPVKYIDSIGILFDQFRGVAVSTLSLNWNSRMVELRGIYVTGEEISNEG
ncbi:hypothetical protein BTO32_15470 [Marinobacter lutaoensis]|uniref:Pilin accessory protein (PilO) n=1 Tax=Marinobacter lutaoensis TaxID=135739 RepID=A0A1V2DPP4_9GAMM|nr:type 4b pilus protein PilO2 [Marinobacter lutaoensis]ONF42605.1 hypothetical protein BTO32_15470 [Marinobacter lutaoensis]